VQAHAPAALGEDGNAVDDSRTAERAGRELGPCAAAGAEAKVAARQQQRALLLLLAHYAEPQLALAGELCGHL